MTRKGIPITNSNILILGITFKENCPDIRNTKVVDIYNELVSYGVKVDVNDPWANKNEKLILIYQDIRSGFEHLEGYLKVFTPLTRSLARKKVRITGKAISDFVDSVFWDRLASENIKLKVTDKFLEQSFLGFTSTIYPAIINLIDNSIFWLGKASGEKTITLDASKTGFIIKDSGPGIPTIDKDNVFEFAFSRKVGGRGMGLYVVRKTLEDEGFEVSLAPYNPNEGACFTITPKIEQDLTDAEV